jgi:CBS domain-containing protein
MITCIISTILSSKLSRESIYTLKLLLRKINLKEGTEINIMKSLYVRDVYSPAFESISEVANFAEVVNKVVTKQDPYFSVLDGQGLLIGIISIHDIKRFLFEKEELRDLIIAGDIALKRFEVVSLDDNCQEVLDKMKGTNFTGLPVVMAENSRKMVGMVWQKDVLDAYYKEIERKDMVATMVEKIQLSEAQQEIRFLEGYSISELPVPKQFIDHSIAELNIRAKYGVDVLSIKQMLTRGAVVKVFPKPETVLNGDDTITVAGKINDIDRIKRLL